MRDPLDVKFTFSWLIRKPSPATNESKIQSKSHKKAGAIPAFFYLSSKFSGWLFRRLILILWRNYACSLLNPNASRCPIKHPSKSSRQPEAPVLSAPSTSYSGLVPAATYRWNRICKADYKWWTRSTKKNWILVLTNPPRERYSRPAVKFRGKRLYTAITSSKDAIFPRWFPAIEKIWHTDNSSFFRQT